MGRIEQLQELISQDTSDSFLQHALAMEYIKLGADGPAREILEGVLEREPGYVGSYYQLGKLLERTGELEQAAAVYRAGMGAARLAGDGHSYNELQSALGEMED